MTALRSEICQMMYFFKIGEQRITISYKLENHPKVFKSHLPSPKCPLDFLNLIKISLFPQNSQNLLINLTPGSSPKICSNTAFPHKEKLKMLWGLGDENTRIPGSENSASSLVCFPNKALSAQSPELKSRWVWCWWWCICVWTMG